MRPAMGAIRIASR